MSQYKVPQDVEADDKLLGPFTFRQLIYLFVAAGFGLIAYLLAQISIVFILIPAPFIIFFTTLALPLKKDQPMETYLAAVISFYLKPRKRFWIPGGQEATIKITAPKVVEDSRIRNISSDEASHQLSFLTGIIDSQGRSIRDTSAVRDELRDEANATPDIFDAPNPSLDRMVSDASTSHHAEIVSQMKASIEQSSRPNISATGSKIIIKPLSDQRAAVINPAKSATPSTSTTISQTKISTKDSSATQPPTKPTETHSDLVKLAHDTDLSVETIAKEAHRITQSHIDETNETFISLH